MLKKLPINLAFVAQSDQHSLLIKFTLQTVQPSGVFNFSQTPVIYDQPGRVDQTSTRFFFFFMINKLLMKLMWNIHQGTTKHWQFQQLVLKCQMKVMAHQPILQMMIFFLCKYLYFLYLIAYLFHIFF